MPGFSPTMYKSHAPVINPYDKLNQNQFDSYVSSIQAKIQVALNPPSPQPLPVSRTIAEISHSTIASPAPSPAPLSKRPSQEARPAYTPLGAGTPNEPFELPDDDDDDEREDDQLELDGERAGSASDSELEAEPEPLSAIPEGTEEGDGVDTDEANYSGYEGEGGNGNEQDDEGPWYSGEDASDDDDLSGAEEAEEVEEEEEDTFIGKGKGRHPGEGPGLAALLNSSSAHRSGGSAHTPERASRLVRAPDDSFDEGVGRMPVLGTTSTPFISRRRTGSPRSENDSDDEDEGSPPWEVDQGLSMPAVAVYQENDSADEEDEGSSNEDDGAGAGQENAIEILDSDEEAEAEEKPNDPEVDEITTSPAPSEEAEDPVDIYAGVNDAVDHQEFDELEFDESAFPHEGREPDSLLDDSMDGDTSAELLVPTEVPGPSSLFSGSSLVVTREPSQSKDIEELDHSGDTIQAPEYSIEEAPAADPEPSLDQPSIQQSIDYSDFIGENDPSLLDTSASLTHTQAEQYLQEVTVYELENGSRYYDHEGVRHFLNTEGEVYETVAIPAPRPTIQQPPELSMIEEVSEWDVTRKMGGDGEGGAEKFDFLGGFDDTFSSVGEPILRYPGEDDSMAFGIDDIPQRPGAAMGFRARDAPGEGASAFLSESAILGDDLANESDAAERYRMLRPVGPESSLVESMTGRNAGDLVSEVDDLVSASEGEGDDVDGDSQDSILDDDDDDSGEMAPREELVTPVPPERVNAGGELPPLDEKGVADALAQLAENASFEELMNVGGNLPGSEPNMFTDPMFDTSSNLENLMNMSAAEEDLLARSFNMVDALQDVSIPLDGLQALGGMPDQNVETVESSILGELNRDVFPTTTAEDLPERLASDVLAEVFEGVDTSVSTSAAGTGTATPTGEPEADANIEEVEERSRSSTPTQSRLASTKPQEPSPRRTPPTPTLSAGRSITAPELSIATSISEGSGMQPGVSIYASSPNSSTHGEDGAHVEPTTVPADPDVVELPDPNLPPAPTHLAIPGDVPDSASEARGEVSPSVMVEPPTPYTRSEDGAVEPKLEDVGVEEEAKLVEGDESGAVVESDAKQTEVGGKEVGEEPEVKEVEAKETEAKEAGVKETEVEKANVEEVEEKVAEEKEVEEKEVEEKEVEEKEAKGESTPDVAEGEEKDEEVDVVGLAPGGATTPSRKSRTRSPSARKSTRASSESRATPTPSEKTRTGEKRKRLDDAPSPPSKQLTPLKLNVRSPARLNGLAASPLSESAPSPNTPTARHYRSLFKRTPTSKPVSTASESSSRKASGSEQSGTAPPAPWPMRHRTHHHAAAAKSSATSPPPLRATSSTSSPITRSNCRFHKVTIPVDDEDDSAKVEFIVPGCALSHHEVMKEQHVEDCGPSTPEEENTMVTDLGDVEPSVVNRLVVLVGTALFNEGVCGYLPNPSVSKVSRPMPTRSKSLRGSLRGSVSEAKAELSAENKAGTLPTKPKPRSRPSIRHADQLYKPPAEDTESDGLAGDEPTPKRPKTKTRDTTGATSSVKFPSFGQDSPEKPAQPTEARIPISKRMKRARRPADAQAFKPNQEESSQDDDAGQSPRKRTKRRTTGTTGTVRRTNSSASTREKKQPENEGENPFKPKNELRRMLSPEAINSGESKQQSISSVLESKPSPAEQKELEQHVELGDHPGEVVDEDGGYVSVEKLAEPAPAKVAAHVDRGAPSEIGKKEANGAGETALGAKSVAKKGWHKWMRL